MRRSKKEGILFLAGFLSLLPFALVLDSSDELIYINMAKALADGLLPYRDFFYPHPPFQLLLLLPLAKTANIFLVKIFIAALSSSCLVLIYLISKKIFKDEKGALVTFLLFLLFPGYLIFSSKALGSIEALLFFLLGLLFLLENKTLLSSLFLTISLFTRYLIVLLIPPVLIYVFGYREKQLTPLLKFLALEIVAAFSLLYLFFGEEYFTGTILYHLSSTIAADFIFTQHYLSFGIFTLSLAAVALFYSVLRKDFKLALFSLYPIIYDLAVLTITKYSFYHYFIFSLPFLFLSVGNISRKNLPLQFLLGSVIVFSFFMNLGKVAHSLQRENNLPFFELAEFVLLHSNKTDSLFGEPYATNYASFATDRKITNNYFDSTTLFINFVGTENFFSKVREASPSLILANEFYLSLFKDGYRPVKEIRFFNSTLWLMVRKENF